MVRNVVSPDISSVFKSVFLFFRSKKRRIAEAMIEPVCDHGMGRPEFFYVAGAANESKTDRIQRKTSRIH